MPPVVERARAYCRAGLQDAVEQLPSMLARICGYCLGWCEADGTPIASRGSRTLQASMVMLAADATGTDPASAVPGAVAVELIHNFSILHDDIIDGDQVRRDRPTAWTVYGIGPTLAAGDALMVKAFQTLLAVPSVGSAAAELLATAVNRMIATIDSEAEFDRRPAADIRIVDYLATCEGKGGALLGVGAVLGTMLCGMPEREGHGLRQAAHYAGTAWQAMNDLENIWGNTALVGKPGFQDLRQHKHTLPVIAALQSGHPTVTSLEALLHKEPMTADDLQQAADLIETAGGKAFAEKIARDYLDRALSTLDTLMLPDFVRHETAELLEFAVTRTPRSR